MRKLNYVYVIEYDGCISREAYKSLDNAVSHLRKQGYKQEFGLKFVDDCNNIALIKDLQVVEGD